MSGSPKIRYAGVLSTLGKRLLNVCFETPDELFELHKEAPLSQRIQVPEEPDVSFDPLSPSYEDD